MTILIYADIDTTCKHNACALTQLQQALIQIRHDLSNDNININDTIKVHDQHTETNLDITFINK